jgi:hypothetical protein
MSALSSLTALAVVVNLLKVCDIFIPSGAKKKIERSIDEITLRLDMTHLVGSIRWFILYRRMLAAIVTIGVTLAIGGLIAYDFVDLNHVLQSSYYPNAFAAFNYIALAIFLLWLVEIPFGLMLLRRAVLPTSFREIAWRCSLILLFAVSGILTGFVKDVAASRIALVLAGGILAPTVVFALLTPMVLGGLRLLLRGLRWLSWKVSL